MIETILMFIAFAVFTSPVGAIIILICFNLPDKRGKRKFNQTHPWDLPSTTVLSRKRHEKEVRRNKRNYYKNKIFGIFK